MSFVFVCPLLSFYDPLLDTCHRCYSQIETDKIGRQKDMDYLNIYTHHDHHYLVHLPKPSYITADRYSLHVPPYLKHVYLLMLFS